MRHWLNRFRLVFALLGPLALLPIVPARAQSAQQSAVLDTLFAQLRTAPDTRTAQALTIEIWRIWTHPSDPELSARISEVLVRVGMFDYPGAIALLDRLVIDHPDYAEAWNQRATVHFLLRNFEQSLADIEKTLAVEPRHFGALAGRALIYLELDQRDLALEAIKAALAIHPFLSEKALFPELDAIQI